jgi:hypothetical protein
MPREFRLYVMGMFIPLTVLGLPLHSLRFEAYLRALAAGLWLMPILAVFQ